LGSGMGVLRKASSSPAPAQMRRRSSRRLQERKDSAPSPAATN
jgi:hypothetical protein